MGKLRKTRKSRPNSKKIRGGVAPNSIHYKYTNNLGRGTWIDTIYPYGGVIMSILPKIRWNSFHYEGPLLIEPDSEFEYQDNNFEYQDNNFKEGDTKIKLYDTMGYTLPLSGPPYEVYGGAACELWGKKIPDIPIHKFIDITGDIDVQVSLPTVIPENAILQKRVGEHGDSYLHPLMVYQDTYTLYGDAFSRWLFHEVIEHFSVVAEQFNIAELDLPKPEEHSETILGDLHAVAGNLLFSRFITKDKSTIKIQITTKVLPDTVSDIIEFIVSGNGLSRSKTKFTVDGIYVNEPYAILTNQVEALAIRSEFVKGNISQHSMSFYKFDNHCARVLYLATLIRFIEGKYYPENNNTFVYMTEGMASIMLKKLYKNEIASMCDAHFGPNYIDKLIDIFESMKYIGAGRLRRMLKLNHI
jgi:hypothetical protein